MVDSKTLHSVLWVQILPFPLVSYKLLSGRQIWVWSTPWLPVSERIFGARWSDSLFPQNFKRFCFLANR